MFEVFLWCAHPDLGNDDLLWSKEFDTLEAAEAFMVSPQLDAYDRHSVSHFHLLGPGVERIVQNPEYSPLKDSGEWSREHARQMGMMGGTAAYNDAIGAG